MRRSDDRCESAVVVLVGVILVVPTTIIFSFVGSQKTVCSCLFSFCCSFSVCVSGNFNSFGFSWMFHQF